MKQDAFLEKLLNIPTTLGEKFISGTKIKKNIPTLDKKKWPDAWKKVYFKGYVRLEEIKLPQPHLPSISLKQSLMDRKSTRKFSNIPLSASEIGNLLYYSAGLRNHSSTYGNRFYPSAGARYPLEIYILSLNTELPKGLYHYYLKSHSLEKLCKFNTSEMKSHFNQSWISKSGLLILITSVFNRTTMKYGDRGYRHILIEAGHLGQNIYLNANALKLSCCAIGGFIDDNLNKLIDIDGVKESIIYIHAIGK